MRVDKRVVLRMRALFGGGFMLLGAAMLWRVLAAPTPTNTKGFGLALGAGLILLGAARIVPYLRSRRGA